MSELNTKYVKAASDALGVQNACNLSGVVHAFSSVISTLWEVARQKGHGTTWVNCHPISLMFSTQIAHLSGGSMTEYEKYRWANQMCKDIEVKSNCSYDWAFGEDENG